MNDKSYEIYYPKITGNVQLIFNVIFQDASDASWQIASEFQLDVLIKDCLRSYNIQTLILMF